MQYFIIVGMSAFWLALFFLLGVAIGSFLNVVADRLPSGKSIVSPPSHCPHCLHGLSVLDMIPIFSYLWLKGRCRYCKTKIPFRLFLVELGTGALFAFLYWYYGLNWGLPITIFYCCLFVALLVIDMEHSILPNKIVYPGIIIALILAIVTEPGIKDAAIGGGIGLGILLIPALIYRGGMGWGDVKLALLIGLVTGFPLVFVAMFLAIVSGGLIAGILLLLKLKGRKDAIPFGPFLALAAMATMFWGNNILEWYLGLA